MNHIGIINALENRTAHPDCHTLVLGVVRQRSLAELTADTALAEATEG